MRFIALLAALVAVSISAPAHAGAFGRFAHDLVAGPPMNCGPNGIFVGAGYGPNGYNPYPHCEYVPPPPEYPAVYPGGYSSPYEGGAYERGRTTGYAERVGQEGGHLAACLLGLCGGNQVGAPQGAYYSNTASPRQVQVQCSPDTPIRRGSYGQALYPLCFQMGDGSIDVRWPAN